MEKSDGEMRRRGGGEEIKEKREIEEAAGCDSGGDECGGLRSSVKK